jgi:hypothetical protein
MNHGARHARRRSASCIRLPPSALCDIAAALSEPRYLGVRFDVELEGEHWMLKVISRMISYRSRMTKVGTGDQALFVRREVFERIGGYPDIPLMEDVAFCRTLKGMGGVACLHSRVVTSARRWETEGVWRTILRMWAQSFSFGVSPARLFYADTVNALPLWPAPDPRRGEHRWRRR